MQQATVSSEFIDVDAQAAARVIVGNFSGFNSAQPMKRQFVDVEGARQALICPAQNLRSGKVAGENGWQKDESDDDDQNKTGQNPRHNGFFFHGSYADQIWLGLLFRRFLK